MQIETILDICETFRLTCIFTNRAVKNPYRFTQLGVGWVLRDVSVHHPKRVIAFLNSHQKDFCSEAIRYATEKLKLADKKEVFYYQKWLPELTVFQCVYQHILLYNDFKHLHCDYQILFTTNNSIAEKDPKFPSPNTYQTEFYYLSIHFDYRV